MPADHATAQIIDPLETMFSQRCAGACRATTRAAYRDDRSGTIFLHPFYLIRQGLLRNMYCVENAPLLYFAIGSDIQNDSAFLIDETNRLLRTDSFGPKNPGGQSRPCQKTEHGN